MVLGYYGVVSCQVVPHGASLFDTNVDHEFIICVTIDLCFVQTMVYMAFTTCCKLSGTLKHRRCSQSLSCEIVSKVFSEINKART